ncbi:hypothetical protein MLD38_003929 [Melastoma candidum]|uniref:Uncharacterized protein n=1 Tax=Melastoma candidum TaxID=119954 RepID=A0ACB9S448_9MYRT|nr:hypothetical protein MLD38_003929 [Melastoma candidum]
MPSRRASGQLLFDTLSMTQLNKDRKEITPHDLPRMFQYTTTLMELMEYGKTDAWLSMELMFHLSILPLTRQLTNISGNLWGRTLQGPKGRVSPFACISCKKVHCSG